MRLVKVPNLALGKKTQIEWIDIVKVARDDLYDTKLADTLSIDNPLFKPTVLVPAATMQQAQVATAPSSIAG